MMAAHVQIKNLSTLRHSHSLPLERIAEIFVHILNQPYSDRISVSGRDPNPTPKGKHFIKYGPTEETNKKMNDLLKELEKWMKN